MQADDTSTFMKLGFIKEEAPRLIVADLLPVEPKSTLNNALAVVAHGGALARARR